MVKHSIKPIWVYGQLPSMKNSRIITVRNGKPCTFKSAKAQEYAKNFAKQITGNLKYKIDVPVELEARIYYSSKRPDLDESLLMDCMEANEIITNDRLIWKKKIEKFFSKNDPRCIFSVRPLSEEEIKEAEGL